MPYSFNINNGSRPPRSHSKDVEYLFVCDRCGTFKDSSDIQTEWTGLVVCSWCFDERHPLLDEADYIHPETDFPTIVRPRSDGTE